MRKAIILLLPGILLLALVAGAAFGCSKENETMDRSNTTTNTSGSVPPIDAAAPAETETATFAMG